MTNNPPSALNHPLIEIGVVTTYLINHSRPDISQFAFAYTITVSNLGDTAVQLLDRHWIITDADDRRMEVRGEGVVGEQPVIKPGEFFCYTSGTTLDTPLGYMEGSYSMITLHSPTDDSAEQERFDVAVPPFSLHTPNALH
jgi:ApaG protein